MEPKGWSLKVIDQTKDYAVQVSIRRSDPSWLYPFKEGFIICSSKFKSQTNFGSLQDFLLFLP